MENVVLALQPENGLKANGEMVMGEDDVSRLHETIREMRGELRSLPDKLVSREVWQQWLQGNQIAPKPVCSTRFTQLEQAMVQRKLFEARVYAIAGVISLAISMTVQFLK